MRGRRQFQRESEHFSRADHAPGRRACHERRWNPELGQESDAETNDPLTCGGYQPKDANSFQFFLGQASLGGILYQIMYTVMNTKPKDTQFCLGRVNFTFTTMSGKPAPQATLPNGLQGYVGLLPMCAPADVGKLVPCVVSKKPSGWIPS